MRALALLLPLLIGAAPPTPPGPDDGVQLAQLTIHERIIIRVPRLGPPSPPPGAPPPSLVTAWTERRGQRCIPMDALAGALVPGPGMVDFVLIGNRRVRARFDRDCHALDFYAGFYVRPPADGMMCAGRDALRTRQGAMCSIRAFHRLVPARAP